MKGRSTYYASGFTLIETLMYVSLLTIVLVALSEGSSTLFRSVARYAAISRLIDEGSFVQDIVSYYAATASRTMYVSTSSSMFLSSDGTTHMFEASTSNIWMSTDGGVSLPLVNQTMQISDVQFIPINDASTSAGMTFSFTLAMRSSEGMTFRENFTKDMYGANK